MKTPHAITSLIKTYGVDVIHTKRPAADATSPWKAAESDQNAQTHLKGLIQHLRPDNSDALPEGGLRAVIILMMTPQQDNPLPGDELVIDSGHWRAATVIPLSSSRQVKLLEVIVTSTGANND